MSDSKKQFADQLVAADPPSPNARQRYENEVRAMLETTLTPRERGAYLMGAVAMLVPAALMGWLVVFGLKPGSEAMSRELLGFVIAYFAATAAAFVAIAGLLFRGYWSGVVRHRRVRGWAVGVGVAYVGLLGWLFLLTAPYIPERLQNDVRVFGLVLLVYAAVAWVRHRVARAEMNTTEKLLELELRLAEIGEKLAGRERTAADPPAE